jgi:hypothetical protein
MKRLGVVALTLIGLVGCGPKTESPDAGSSPYIAGFNPPAQPAGYTRFTTPVIKDIAPGTNQMWCQWLAAPSDHDQDVVDVTGLQSKYGHHVVLYATSEMEDVGTTRVCTGADMESVRFVGAIGGEGNAGLYQKFPPNTVLRLPKGWALMANVHYINVGSTAIDGQAVLDVKFTDPTPEHKVAGFFTDTTDQFSIPTGAPFTLDVTCSIKQDLDFFIFANHMHQWGTSIFSEAVRADGTKQMIADDEPWQAEEEFNPKLNTFTTEAPFSVKAGDTIHTRCTWNNDTAGALAFPNEMCVGFGFFVPADASAPAQEIDCVNGTWSNN